MCSVLSVSATYASLRGVTVTTMSLSRFDLLLQGYIEQRQQGRGQGEEQKQKQEQEQEQEQGHGQHTQQPPPEGNILTPEQLRASEYLLGAPHSALPPLHVGAHLQAAVRCGGHMRRLSELYAGEEFIVNAYSDGEGHGEVHMLLKEHATLSGIIAGLTLAHTLRSNLHKQGIRGGAFGRGLPGMLGSTGAVWHYDQLKSTLEQVKQDKRYQEFAVELMRANSAGVWIVDALMLEPTRARIMQE